MERFWGPFKRLVEEKTESVDRNEATGARQLGTDPKSGRPLSVRLGRYGPFAQIGTKDDEEKPRFASLRAGQSMHTITAAEALELFRLPRTLGVDENGEEITVGVGRFGPFVKRGTMYASLKPEDDPYTIELARAQQLIRDKVEMLANRIIRDFGNGVQILNGRYGPYITDGKKNARIPKDREPASLDEAECAELLAAAPERGRGGFGRGRGRSAKSAGAAPAKKVARKTAARKAAPKKKSVTAKSTAKKKSSARKATAKKAAPRKSAARKSARTAPQS
jgi:DNA topoisomerase-1